MPPSSPSLCPVCGAVVPDGSPEGVCPSCLMQAAMQPNCSDWLRKRAQLNAGEMYDLLHDRANAVRMYQMTLSAGGDQSQADTARKYLKTPFTGK